MDVDPNYETKLTALLTAVERHIESGRCKVVHTPSGIEALVPASTVRARYSKIYQSYNRIRSVLASDTNEYLPFYRLHDDLVVEIWDYLDICDRNNVTAVSRRFRSLALNTARLWRFINLNGSPSVPRIETLLKRAGVVPLYIRATDHHLRELRPSFPVTSLPWPLPTTSLPPPPPPPPNTFHHNLPSPLGLSPYVPPLTFSFYPQHPQYPPVQPIPIPPKSLQLSAEIISRAAVLDIVSQQLKSTNSLGISLLAVPMPILRSLRLRSLQFSVSPQASTPTIQPFFGGHTPLLRHLSVIGFHLSWSAPVFRNLTYLLVRKPDARLSVSLLVQVLRGCPSLTYLGLEAAILSTVPTETSSSVELPSLQRLYITDMDSQRITTALNHISAPNVLECDFTSADWSWFDSTHLATNSSPFNNLQAAQHVTLRTTDHNAYRWTIECRWEASQAVRFHFDPPVTKCYLPGAGDEGNEATRFIDALRRSPILFGHVRSLTLWGTFNIATLARIFGLFPEIENLSTRSIYPSRGPVGENRSIVDILSVHYCPQLRAIDIGPLPALAPHNLLVWLSTRSAPGGGCSRLNRVVVTSTHPLPSKMRSKISPILDKFMWRMPTIPILPYNGKCFTPLVSPTFPLQPFTNVSAVPSSHQVEDGGWDTDDEEGWTRVSPDELLSNVPSDTQDDPTLVYCDRAWRGRWDYFAIPEK